MDGDAGSQRDEAEINEALVDNKSPQHHWEPPRRGHTPTSTEMYGFVSWLLSAAFFFTYLLWAYVPDVYFDAIGISYRPAKYWAIAIPAWLVATWVFYLTAAVALSFVNTKQIACIYTLRDEHSRPEATPQSQRESPAGRIPAMGDIPISKVNQLLYI
jgi:phosphatidylinositol N-acetylglucosaminyltransferase subunit P